jgi:predicted TIM-barrel fold metal-dependent hydrolase
VIVDCHVHSLGVENVDAILKGMDKAGIDKAVIFSPYPSPYMGREERIIPRTAAGVTRHLEFSYPNVTSEKQREAVEFIARIQREASDRVIGFIWLEPRLKDAVQILEWAITSKELKGVKMIPDHWYPYDEFMYPIYRKAEELNIPILFHSGILYGFKDSSRFCRPVNYEVLLSFPKLRFALAHVSWPWVDECIAVWGRFRAALEEVEGERKEVQMFIDATPGTPLIYRKDALQKVMAFGAEDYVMFGTDCTAGRLEYGKYHVERDLAILRQVIGVSKDTVDKFLGKNALRFLGLK